MPADPAQRDAARPFPRRGLAPAGVLTLAFLLLTWPVILSGRGGTSEASDQDTYHLPTIRSFEAQWPRPDLRDYASATTPGYHLALAAFARVVSPRQAHLQLFASLFSLALALAAWRIAARWVDPWAALALTAPLACSAYFIGSAIWLVTDNAALLWTALALGGAVGLAPTPARVTRWGLYATLATLIRQTSVWVAGPVALAAALMGPPARYVPAPLRSAADGRRGWGAIAACTPAIAAPFAVVVAFALLWHGLTPPSLAAENDRGVNPMMPAMVLAVFGGVGVFFLPAFVRTWRELLRVDAPTIAAVVGALALALAFPTTFDRDAGRWGGAVWRVVRVAPAFADRSLVFPPLAAVGALVLCRAWSAARAAARGRDAAMLFIGLAGWTAALAAGSLAYQRYVEPLALMSLAWLAAMSWAGRTDGAPPACSPRLWAGPALLGLIQLALSGLTLYMEAWRCRPPA